LPILTSSGVRAHRSKILSKGPARPGCCNGLDLERAPESRPQPIPSGVGGFTTSGNPKDVVVRAIEAAHRPADAVELRQVAALGCNEDGDRARRKIGAMLAFLAGYVIGDRDLGARGVPARHRKQRRYSTRARATPREARCRPWLVRLSRAALIDPWDAGRNALPGLALRKRQAPIACCSRSVLVSNSVRRVELFRGRPAVRFLRRRGSVLNRPFPGPQRRFRSSSALV